MQFPRHPRQGEGIASDTVGGRLDDRHAGSGRDRRIRGVSAPSHYLEAGLRGERGAGGDNRTRNDRLSSGDIRQGPVKSCHANQATTKARRSRGSVETLQVHEVMTYS